MTNEAGNEGKYGAYRHKKCIQHCVVNAHHRNTTRRKNVRLSPKCYCGLLPSAKSGTDKGIKTYRGKNLPPLYMMVSGARKCLVRSFSVRVVITSHPNEMQMYQARARALQNTNLDLKHAVVHIPVGAYIIRSSHR